MERYWCVHVRVRRHHTHLFHTGVRTVHSHNHYTTYIYVEKNQKFFRHSVHSASVCVWLVCVGECSNLLLAYYNYGVFAVRY